MGKEIWIECINHRNYQVSNYGRIRRFATGKSTRPLKIVNGFLDDRGYRKVTIANNDGITKRVPVHLLIAQTFNGERPVGLTVNHKDGDKSNNRPENLEYLTAVENTKHAHRNGLYPHTKSTMENKIIFNAKLSIESVLKIKKLLLKGIKPIPIAKIFNVSRTCIYDIKNGRRWRWVVMQKLTEEKTA